MATVRHDTLAIIMKQANVCALKEVDDSTPVTKHMVWHDTNSMNAFCYPLPPSVCHRAPPHIFVAQGNHDVSLDSVTISALIGKSVSIFSFPARSKKQFANSIKLSSVARTLTHVLDGNVGATCRHFYDKLNSDRIKNHYLTILATPSDVTITSRYFQEERFGQALCILRTGETQ